MEIVILPFAEFLRDVNVVDDVVLLVVHLIDKLLSVPAD